MHTTEGREENVSRGRQGTGSRGLGDFSSLELDEKDKEILSVVCDRPSTLLSISDKTNIPFVECLFRARKLREKGLLEKLSETCDANGLYLYAARWKAE